jgi:hypothetical protein
MLEKIAQFRQTSGRRMQEIHQRSKDTVAKVTNDLSQMSFERPFDSQ